MSIKVVSCFKELLSIHGHRAPTATLVPNDIGHSFNAAWQELAVSHSDPILSPLNKYYPVVNSPVNKAPNDAKHYPFGSLTYIGAEHMYNVGKGLGEAFPQLRQVPLDEYSVTATNYQRTQRSAQFLLNGLHDTRPSSSFHDRSFEYFQNIENINNIPISVSEQTHCPLNFYERNVELTVKLVNNVLHKEPYQKLENSAELMKAKKVLGEAYSVLEKGRYGFNWPVAFDYFSCSRGHKLEILPELEEFEHLVSRHYIYRYWLYNRDPHHLAHFIQPFLQTLVENIVHIHQELYGTSPKGYTDLQAKHKPKHSVTTTLGKPITAHGKIPRLIFYSAHDINIFSLLMTLGIESIVRGPQSQGDQLLRNIRSVWPYYGSTVLLEINADEKDHPVIQLYWNRELQPVDVHYMKDFTNDHNDEKLFQAEYPKTLKKETQFSFIELVQLTHHLQHYLVQDE